MLGQHFEKQNLTINVSAISLFLLMQTIVNNEEGLLKNLEDAIGLLPEGKEAVMETIIELYELSKKTVMLSI